MGFLRVVSYDQVAPVSLISAAIIYNFPIGGTIGLILAAYIAYYHGDFIYRSYLTLNRDLSGLALLLRVKFDLSRRISENRGIHELFLDVVKKNSDKTAVIDVRTSQSLTFREFNELSNRFANYFQVYISELCSIILIVF